MKRIVGIILAVLMTVGFINSSFAEQAGSQKAADEQVEEWGKWLEGDEVFGREEGAFKLGVSKNPKAVKFLLNALSDKEPTVRQYAVSGIRNFKSTDAIQYLKAALEIEDVPYMIANILETLMSFNVDEMYIASYLNRIVNNEDCTGGSIVPFMKNDDIRKEWITIMKHISLNGEKIKVRVNCATTLIEYLNEDPNQYLELFMTAIESTKEQGMDGPDEQIKTNVIRVLKKIGTPVAIEAIKKGLNSENDVVKDDARKFLEKLEKKTQ